MQVFRYPERAQWNEFLKRPLFDSGEIFKRVRPILESVRSDGDSALRRFTEQFDGVRLDYISCTKQEFSAAENQLPSSLKEAIRLTIENIRKFHESQKIPTQWIETMPGVVCWRKQVPIERVGLYIPGGSAPLFSTLLMLGIPALIAGCSEIIVCSPPDRNGNIHPAILFSAQEIGIEKIFKVGGAQAIAALAYGTETIPQVYKIFGPGNQFVTTAKQLVSLETVAIDMPAGPSEVAVIADASADPDFVASDLLSQAEHGADSQVILVTTSEPLIRKVLKILERQLKLLPREKTAQEALRHSRIFLVDNLDSAFDLINSYAPEHLILNVSGADDLAEKVINAGSVFIGPYTPESAGDYASGTNHTLPTNGYARSYSGVSLDSFMKQITFQKISAEGLQNIGPAIEAMAAAELLQAHMQAVSLRLGKIIGDKSGD